MHDKFDWTLTQNFSLRHALIVMFYLRYKAIEVLLDRRLHVCQTKSSCF
jgi:hypothetical protein